MKYKCNSCKKETEDKYDLVLFACGIRLWLCKKCYYKALGKELQENDRRTD